jgi:phosphoenolpyruvate phosphomutase
VLLHRVASTSVAQAAPGLDAPTAHGRWIGLLSARGAGRERLVAKLAELKTQPGFDSLDLPALLNALIDGGERIEVLYVHGHWRGVNDLDDFRSASAFAQPATGFAAASYAAPAAAAASSTGASAGSASGTDAAGIHTDEAPRD